ncbi:MAG: hypothetical protein J5656_05745 [Clostridia bacterium]|nr:hypothetical protein [Clostridia bacterium]
MFKKIIYKEAYDELMKEFKHIAEDNVPYAYKRTNYNGWFNLKQFMKHQQCDIIKHGNLSYFIDTNICIDDDKQMHVIFNLTDTTADEKYTEKYYDIEMDVIDNKTTKRFVERDPKNKLDYKKWVHTSLNSFDFAWYKDHFIMLGRDDNTCGGLYTLFVFGDKAETIINEFIGEEDIKFTNTTLLQDIKYVYLEEKFEKENNVEVLKKIEGVFQNAVKENNYNLFKEYVEDEVIYTNMSLYGFEDINGVQQIFNKIVDCKEVILIESIYGQNKITTHIKRKTNDNRVHHMIIEMAINYNHKVYSVSEIEPWLYNMPEYEK